MGEAVDRAAVEISWPLCAADETIARLEQDGEPPDQAFPRFVAWLAERQRQRRPVYVAFNAAFDWAFTHHWFVRLGMDDPFGFAPLDIKSYWAGRSGAAGLGCPTRGAGGVSRLPQRHAAFPGWAAMEQPWPGQSLPDVPCTYILCTEDNVLPPARQREMAARLSVEPAEIASDHAVFAVRPRESGRPRARDGSDGSTATSLIAASAASIASRSAPTFRSATANDVRVVSRSPCEIAEISARPSPDSAARSALDMRLGAFLERPLVRSAA